MPNPKITLDEVALDVIAQQMGVTDHQRDILITQAREAVELERENMRLRGFMTGAYEVYNPDREYYSCAFCGEVWDAGRPRPGNAEHHTPDCPVPPMKEQQERATQEHDG